MGFTNPVGTGGVLDVYLCLGCGGVGAVGGEWVGDLDQGLEWCGGVMFVLVVSPDSLCSWQVHVYVYCARQISAHLRCTQYLILLHRIDICFRVFVYSTSRLVCVLLSDLDLSRHHTPL